MIYKAMVSILILYFFYAVFVTPLVKKTLGIKLCAICAACSSTWLGLLALKIGKILEVDATLIGVLMGGSTVGIMYALQNFFKKNNFNRFYLVRILVVLSGYFLSYSVAIWNAKKTFYSILVSLFTAGMTFMLIFLQRNRVKKNENEKDENEEISEEDKQSAIEKIEKSLEDCCD